MKRCFKCNRTYDDDTLNFCLDDGEMLTSISESVTEENISRKTEEKTAILSDEQIAKSLPSEQKTETLPNDEEILTQIASRSHSQTIQQGVSPIFAYLTVGLLAILVLIAGSALVFWVNSNSRNVANTNKEIAKNNSNSSDPILLGKEGTKPAPTQRKIVENKKTPKKVDKTPSTTPTKTPKQEDGKWFVILGSYPKSQAAKANKRLQFARSKGLNARIINTGQYSGLRKGLTAVVLGPFSKSAAQSNLQKVKSIVPDAYAKSAS